MLRIYLGVATQQWRILVCTWQSVIKYCNCTCSPTFTYGFCPLSYANQLSVGDEVMGIEEDELTPTIVINVSEFTM